MNISKQGRRGRGEEEEEEEDDAGEVLGKFFCLSRQRHLWHIDVKGQQELQRH